VEETAERQSAAASSFAPAARAPIGEDDGLVLPLSASMAGQRLEEEEVRDGEGLGGERAPPGVRTWRAGEEGAKGTGQ
jgi:hypothetical protein